jgi:glycosyltransferase involved in cell wall biosynthesis
VVIHHGIDASPGRRPAQQSDGSRRTILSVGNLIPQKGFAELLQAFSQVQGELPDVDLVIVGVGPERDRLRRLSSSLGLGERVRFLGWQPHDAVLDLQEQASVFCLASVDEGFGLVYLEAMGCGTPVIGSEGEGIADIVIHGENGLLVPPRAPSAIAAALLRILRDDDLRRGLAEAGKQTAGALTWERNAQRHLDLYRRVIEEHGRG